MESSEDVDEFEDMVMSYLANIEGMQLTESERIFTFTIGIIAVEAAKFWEVNGDEIVEISGQGRINGWSWGSFAGAVLGGATTGALAGAAVGGTASLGTLAVPSAVAGGLLRGIGYAVNEVIKGIE